MKKFLALLLTLCLIVPIAVACKSTEAPGSETTDTGSDELAKSPREEVVINAGSGETGELTVEPDLTLVKDEDFAEYEEWELYKEVLGDYYTYLLAAKAQTDVSARYALMAIAEAKLLESGVMLPTSSNGGGYAISRVAPNTAPRALWGFDSDRYENIIVATEFIKAADREVMKAKYVELKGTGTYESWAKQYLTAQGYTLKDSYSLGSSSDPETWDIMNTYLAADTEKIVNTIEGLLSYDCEGRLTYALAKNVTVSDDGLTYTFTLRDGLKWVTQEGQEYADLTAQDFVDGMQYLLDKQAGLEYLLFGVIKNAEEYASGTVTFDQVGVKATDDKTLVYTLAQKTSYFLTMLEYNIFMPICKEFAESKGENYGTSPENILYCGPYLVKNYTSENRIVFEANPFYWAKDDVNIKTLTMIYYDGKDATKPYSDAVEGVIDGAGLTTVTLPLAAKDKLFETYAYVSGTDATSFSAFINLNRQAYSTIYGLGMESSKTDAQKAASIEALKNLHFRMAIMQSLDRAMWNATKSGEVTKLNALRNTYTPGTFVALERDIKIKIGDTYQTFKKGTYYGEIVQAQLTADGSQIKVWDPTGGDGDGSSDGFDGWYNVEAAREELAKAIEELANLNISADNPICLDLPYVSTNSNYSAAANAFKQSVEAALEGKVIINLVAAEKFAGWYYAGYYCTSGSECNYDLYDCSGWGPDYGDPATYLNTFLPASGDLLHVLGLR